MKLYQCVYTVRDESYSHEIYYWVTTSDCMDNATVKFHEKLRKHLSMYGQPSSREARLAKELKKLAITEHELDEVVEVTYDVY